jgi:hypothetical protein
MLAEKFIGVVSMKVEMPAEVINAMHGEGAAEEGIFAIDKLESDPVNSYDEAKTYIADHVEAPGFLYGQVEKVFVKAEPTDGN